MPKNYARRLLFKLFILGLLSVALAFGIGSTPKRQISTPRVINSTRYLEVMGVTQGDGAYVLTLKNTSDKAANGFSVGTNPYSRHDVDYTISERLLKAGEVTEVDVPISSQQNSA